MIVGVVKEIKNNEFRVGLTPDDVKAYKDAGHTVLVEAGAGEGSSFSDEEYAAAGAELIEAAADVWAKSEMIVKVKSRSNLSISTLEKTSFCIHICILQQISRSQMHFWHPAQIQLHMRPSQDRAADFPA